MENPSSIYKEGFVGAENVYEILKDSKKTKEISHKEKRNGFEILYRQHEEKDFLMTDYGFTFYFDFNTIAMTYSYMTEKSHRNRMNITNEKIDELKTFIDSLKDDDALSWSTPL